MRGTATHDRFVLAGAAAFLVAHLAWLPRHLEDIDSLNFALGLAEYDVAAHQPHPPGYPIFILLARGATLVASPFADAWTTVAALGMAGLAAVAGALALLALYAILRTLERRDASGAADSVTPALATALTALTPLYWITALRPLSDMPGLAAALVCQWLLLRAAGPAASSRAALIAAFACGVAVGVRSQVTWLVVPLLLWLMMRVWRGTSAAGAAAVGVSALAGVLAWAVPMVAMTGGPAAYRAALASQAGEDFEGVPMLVMQPGVRRLLTALADTFVEPWAWWPLATVVVFAAGAGAVALRRGGLRRTWLLLGGLPYLVYHLLFQETETTRYALPLVPFVAVLVVMAARRTGRVGALVAASLALLAGGVSVQAHRQYVTAGAAVPQVLHEVQMSAAASRPHVLMHRRVWAETRRARAMFTPAAPSFSLLPSPRALEWRAAADVWQRTPDARVWWMVDPRRGDRVAVDPRALHLRRRVAWPEPVASALGGMRPHAFDWYDVTPPHWVLLDGWGLTPELAGLAAAAGQGPSSTGAHALVRAMPGDATLVVGGRHVAPAGAAPLPLDVRLGAWSRRVDVPPGPFAFTWTLPAGTVAAGYGTLAARVTAARSGSESVYLEQFDVQPAGTPVVALERGWYEPERDVATGRTWRWVADDSTLRIAGGHGDVRMIVQGTWPRHYDRDPVLDLWVAGRRIATHTLGRPFRIEQRITAEQWRADGGRVTWRVSPSFVAGQRTGTADARRLALEIASLQVEAIR